MARACKTDPLKVFRFRVLIDDAVVGGFRTCAGIEKTTEVAEYREGNDPTVPRKSDGMSNSGDITLSKGVTFLQESGDVLYEWARAVSDDTGDRGSNLSSGRDGGGYMPEICAYRHDLQIELFDKLWTLQKAWVVYNAWPSRYKPCSDLDSMDTTGIALEEIVLANEGFEIIYPKPTARLSAAAGTGRLGVPAGNVTLTGPTRLSA